MGNFRQRVFLVALLVLGLLSACNGLQTREGEIVEGVESALPTETKHEAEVTASEPTMTPEPEGVAVESIVKEKNPLTGLFVDVDQLAHRPVAVKISNYPRSNRPQWGLSYADIVYEYYHNHDLTRFHAIFLGEDAELAGPIRSARLPDNSLMDIYESVMVFASADYRVMDRLRFQQAAYKLIYLLEGRCPPQPVCRYAPEDTRHLVADTAAVSIYSEERGGGELAMPSLEGMAFSNDPVRAGEVVEKINLRYSYSAYSYWQYEAESGVYTRYQDIVEDFSGDNERFNVLRDRLNSKAIAASNVVVILVPHWHFFYRAASGSSPMVEVVDMDFSGRGQAYMFRDGMAFELEWVNDGVQLLHLVDAEGEVFPFKPGVTWFQVMSEESFFSVDGDHWRFQFVFERP